MARLIDVLRRTIGGDPTDSLIAVLSRDYQRFAEAFLETYELMGPPAVPKKEQLEFVPAWLVDHIEIGDGYHWRSPREARFVARSILYAHRIVVPSPIEKLQYLAQSLQPARNAVNFVHQLVAYGPLEDAGILHYAERAQPNFGYWDSRRFSEQELRTYAETVLEAARGWKVIPSSSAQAFYTPQLRAEIAQLEALLVATSERAIQLDLYVPRWLLPTFRWAAAQNDKSVLSNAFEAATDQDQQYVDALFYLPAINDDAVYNLNTSDLIGLRDSDVFIQWRNTLRASLQQFTLRAVSHEYTKEAIAEFQHELLSRKHHLTSMLASQSVRRLLRGAPLQRLAMGVIAPTAAAAVFSNYDAAVTLATGAASSLGGPLYDAFAKWMKRTKIEKAIDAHFRLFAGG